MEKMSDLISRKAAIDEVHHAVYKFFDIVEDDDESPITYNDKRLLELNKAITSRLKELPSADRPTGHIVTSGIYPTVWAECSECGTPIDPWDKFCRHCGVKVEV